MPVRLKQWLFTTLIRMPLLRYFVYRYYVYRNPLNEKALRGKIQYLGHCIDLGFSDSYTIPKAKVYELKYHLRVFFKSKYQVDDSILWAIKMLVCYQNGMKPLQSTASVIADANVDEFDNIVKQRRSVRKWLSQDVSHKDLTRVIEWATWAPSSCNRQPWQVMVIAKEEDKREIAKYFPNQFYTAAPVVLLILVDSTLYGEIEKPFVYLDAGAFIQNLLLGFHILGYGACWIGFNRWNGFDESYLNLPEAEQFYTYFGINRKVLPVSLVAAGRPSAVPNAPSRQSPDAIRINF